jgi:predicted GNAT family acetyltransferase
MTSVSDNPSLNRFEMPVDGHVAFVSYRRNGDVISLDHAEVPRELEGRGIGSKLVKATLDAIRTEGIRLVPRCSFVAAYVRRHPEYADMLAPS